MNSVAKWIQLDENSPLHLNKSYSKTILQGHYNSILPECYNLDENPLNQHKEVRL